MDENIELCFTTIKNRQLAELTLLLDVGVDLVNARSSNGGNRTLLHHAVVWSSVEVMRLLLDRGADILLADEYGRNALMQAAYRRMVFLLLLPRMVLEESIMPMMISTTLITYDDELQTGRRTDGVTLRNQDNSGVADVYLRPHNDLIVSFFRRVLSFLDPYGVVAPEL